MHKEIIHMVVEYIQYQYADIQSLEDISEEMHVNYHSLRESFSKEMGMTMCQFLNRIRCKKAREILRTTDLKLYAVAQDVGFRNDKYFIKVFEKYEGISPKNYRKRFKNNK
jgi:two-component system response regulator YesN